MRRGFAALFLVLLCTARVDISSSGRFAIEGNGGVPDEDAVAVCVSGSLRDALRPLGALVARWPDAKVLFRQLPETEQLRFLALVNGTGIAALDTFHMFLYPSLGRFDVFMYVPTAANERANASVARREAEAVCRAFVPADQERQLVCGGGLDRRMQYDEMGFGTEEEAQRFRGLWKKRATHDLEKFLWQLHGLKQCNAMIRETETRLDSAYAWIVRARADLVFFAPMPPIAGVPRAERVVYARKNLNGIKRWGGNIDIFYFGHASVMHSLLDCLRDCPRLRTDVLRKKFNGEIFIENCLIHVHGGHFEFLDGLRVHPYRYKTMAQRIHGRSSLFRLPPRPNMHWRWDF